MSGVPSWVGQALDIAETQALNRAAVDWPAVRDHVLALAPTCIAADQPAAVLTPMFRALGDGHSFLVVGGDRSVRSTGGAGADPVPTCSMLAGDVPCLGLPGVRAPDFRPPATH